ncbi:MAG: cob(I)yrinic acid a,c-diamide adenosyltransferase [Candidatus Schekmanbacteria bacterium]|nr:cob(I)yrinic acid a,c-diamide adenosyltransferase [Candidatus Schekmanbacteria bacterium]
MPRLTRLYTRKGDAGETRLGDGQVIAKDEARVAAYGSVDELSAAVGLAVALGVSEEIAADLTWIQNELLNAGADLCVREEDKAKRACLVVEATAVVRLEHRIDELTELLGPLADFLLPGGTAGAAQLHVARTVCRRAERDIVALRRREAVSATVLQLINRLSDYLFAAARYENHRGGITERLWDKDRR